MKRKLTVVALMAAAVGFTAGLFGNHLVSPARAESGRIINVAGDDSIRTKCNFDKTIILSQRMGVLCVAL